MPYLLPENEKAVDVFMIAANQIRYSSMGKPIGLDLNAVIEIIKMMKIQNSIDIINKVMLLSHELISNAD